MIQLERCNLTNVTVFLNSHIQFAYTNMQGDLSMMYGILIEFKRSYYGRIDETSPNTYSKFINKYPLNIIDAKGRIIKFRPNGFKS